MADRPEPPLEWTLLRAEKEFGTDRHKLKGLLDRAGHKPDENGKYTTIQLHRALTSDYDAARTRLANEQADKVAIENQKRRGELIEVTEAAVVTQQFTVAARQIVVLSKMAPEDKNKLLAELRALAEIDWSKLEEYRDEEE